MSLGPHKAAVQATGETRRLMSCKNTAQADRQARKKGHGEHSASVTGGFTQRRPLRSRPPTPGAIQRHDASFHDRGWARRPVPARKPVRHTSFDGDGLRPALRVSTAARSRKNISCPFRREPQLTKITASHHRTRPQRTQAPGVRTARRRT